MTVVSVDDLCFLMWCCAILSAYVVLGQSWIYYAQVGLSLRHTALGRLTSTSQTRDTHSCIRNTSLPVSVTAPSSEPPQNLSLSSLSLSSLSLPLPLSFSLSLSLFLSLPPSSAPEVLNSHHSSGYSYAVDWWGLGSVSTRCCVDR